MSRSHHTHPVTATAALRTRVRQRVATITDGAAADGSAPGTVPNHTLRPLETEHPAVRLDDVFELCVVVDAPPVMLNRRGETCFDLFAAGSTLLDVLAEAV